MDDLVDLVELTLDGDISECEQRLRERPDPAHDAALLALMLGFMLRNSAARQGFTVEQVMDGLREEIAERL